MGYAGAYGRSGSRTAAVASRRRRSLRRTAALDAPPLTCGNSRPDRPHGDLRPAGHTDCRALALERTRPQKIAGLAMDVEAETEVAAPGRAATVAHRQ